MTFAPQPKPESRKRVKGRKSSHERRVKKAVRALCVERDGYCRLHKDEIRWHECNGASQWMHLEPRARTVGMAPEHRHRTETSMMGCQLAHDNFDGKIGGKKLAIDAETDRGADGPLRFRRLP